VNSGKISRCCFPGLLSCRNGSQCYCTPDGLNGPCRRQPTGAVHSHPARPHHFPHLARGRDLPSVCAGMQRSIQLPAQLRVACTAYCCFSPCGAFPLVAAGVLLVADCTTPCASANCINSNMYYAGRLAQTNKFCRIVLVSGQSRVQCNLDAPEQASRLVYTGAPVAVMG
jgi:hypothetical protein